MVSPKWYAPNPYKSVEGMCSGKSSMMVLLLGLQAILCSLYLSYDMMDVMHRDESDNNDIISPEPSFKPNRMMVEDTVNKNDIILHYKKPERKYSRTMYTRDDFVVNGVNLGQYSFEEGEPLSIHTVHLQDYVGLFEDFTLEPMLHHLKSIKEDPSTTEENSQEPQHSQFHINSYNNLYTELYNLRHDLKDFSLSFYGDKVASQRTRRALGIPQAKKHALMYKLELESQVDPALRLSEVHSLIPTHASYVAKNSHLTCSWGINVVKYDTETKKHSLLLSRKTKDGVGLATKQGEDFEYNSMEVAEDLLLNLDIKAAEAESYSLTQIKPGLVIEDRFTQPLTQPGDNDVMPAFEFNVFTVWGKVLFANCKTGNKMHLGWVDHNGKPFGYDETAYKTWQDESARNNIDSLPDWVDWSEVVRVAEMMAVGKDTMRVDVFVGMSADDPAMRLKDVNDPNTKAQQKQAVSTVVNELEFFSTLWVPEAISEEIARLWYAGYDMGIYKHIPNSDVPPAFVEKGYLAEEDLAQWVIQKSKQDVTTGLRLRGAVK